MQNYEQIRTALERYLRRPLDDSQWKVLVSQGYVRALSMGERSFEDVARELDQLRALLRSQGIEGEHSTPLSWEDMERLVLARTLFGRQPRENRWPSGTADCMTSTPAEELGYPRRRRWTWAAVIVVAIAVIIALVGLYFADANAPRSAATTSSPSLASGASSTTAPAPSTTIASPTNAETSAASSSTTMPPTTTSLATTTTASTTTTVLIQKFTARLSGSEAVPAVSTAASGTLTLTVSDDGSSVDYVLEVSGLDSLTVARLRHGVRGEIGEEIFTLYGGPTKTGGVSGIVAEGTFSAADLLGPLEGKTIADLVALIQAGSVYVNVGSNAYTRGEIRGQLE